jgi:hypothetical protein
VRLLQCVDLFLRCFDLVLQKIGEGAGDPCQKRGCRGDVAPSPFGLLILRTAKALSPRTRDINTNTNTTTTASTSSLYSVLLFCYQQDHDSRHDLVKAFQTHHSLPIRICILLPYLYPIFWVHSRTPGPERQQHSTVIATLFAHFSHLIIPPWPPTRYVTMPLYPYVATMLTMFCVLLGAAAEDRKDLAHEEPCEPFTARSG